MLRDEITAMFAELDGYDRYELELERFTATARAAAVVRTREWRKANPARNRALSKRSRKAWAKRNPQKVLAAKARHREKHREHMREVWRRNTAAYRKRKQAAQLELA